MKKTIASRAEECLNSLFRKSLTYIARNRARKLEFLFLPYALLKIKLLNRKCNLDEALDFAFNGCGGLISPFQIRSEILGLLKILDKMKLEVILEIGTAKGGALFLFSCIASENATIISIDLPGGKFGGGYPIWKILLYRFFKRGKQKLYLIRGDSHDEKTLEKVKGILNGKKIDFLFIDGDHTYEGVKKDFKMYSKLVKREESNSPTRYSLSFICSRLSGREILEGDKARAQGKRNNFFAESNMSRDWDNFHIGFHDIVPGISEWVGGVPEFWQEIKSNYEFMEIVEDWNQGTAGIGLIRL